MKRLEMNIVSTNLIVAAFVAGFLVAAAPHAEAQPTITSPTNGSEVGARFTVGWQGIQGKQMYHVCIERFGTSNETPCARHNEVLTNRYSFTVPQSLIDDNRGTTLLIKVKACESNTGPCQGGAYSNAVFVTVKPAVPSGVPTLSTPQNGINISNSTPSFSWSSVSGATSYVLQVIPANGTYKNYADITSPSYTLPASNPIPDSATNPISWKVAACNSGGCGSFSSARQFNFTGAILDSSPNQLSPANGAQAEAGTVLSWSAHDAFGGQGSYYSLCLASQVEAQSQGCRITKMVGTNSFTLTAAEVDHKSPPRAKNYYFGDRLYWAVTACLGKGQGCSQNPTYRYVTLQHGGGGSVGGGTTSTTPAVSFATHLYPTIASQQCDSCHQSNSRTPVYYPQKADGAPRNCTASTIPFNTTITAAEMLNRFKCLKARSQDGLYEQALNKIYVVPLSSSQSGLHWKAQKSTASIFSSNMTIDGVTKQLKEWIQIWIDQGANP